MGAMVERDVLRVIGGRIRALREARGITQADLAERIGLNRTSVTNLEAGRQNVPVTVLSLAAAELGSTVGALLGEAALPEVPPVHVAVLFVVACEVCGEVGTAPTQGEAGQVRQRHILSHLNGEVAGEVTG